MSNRQAQLGFTLIELLIALSISAVIAILSYQSISQVSQVKLQTQTHTEKFSSLQRTLWWMEQDFSQMVARSVQDTLGQNIPAYQARNNQVELTRIAVYPSPYGVSGLVRVGYALEEGTLYRIVWPVLDRAPDTEPKRLAVLEGVSDFHIRQLKQAQTPNASGNNNSGNSDNAPSNGTQTAEWLDDWPKSSKNLTELPGLVEIRFNYEGFGEVRRLVLGADS